MLESSSSLPSYFLSASSPFSHGFLSAQHTMEETHGIFAQPHSGFSPAILHLPRPEWRLQPHWPQTLATYRLRPGWKAVDCVGSALSTKGLQSVGPCTHQHVPRPAFFLANLSFLSSSCLHFLIWGSGLGSYVLSRWQNRMRFMIEVELVIWDGRRKRRKRKKRRVEGVCDASDLKWVAFVVAPR